MDEEWSGSTATTATIGNDLVVGVVDDVDDVGVVDEVNDHGQ